MITFDIETLPTDNEDAIKRILDDLRPPSNYKTEEAIAKWMEEAKKKAILSTSLDGAYGRIACICAMNDSEILIPMPEETEKDHLMNFFDFVGKDTIFCGHNIAGFDLQFLKHRCIVNNIKPPAGLLAAMNAKPWDDCIKDTMLMWSKTKMISLDTLAWVLGIENKNTFDGSMVAEMWENDPDLVIGKCFTDVNLTHAVYQRLTFYQSVF